MVMSSRLRSPVNRGLDPSIFLLQKNQDWEVVFSVMRNWTNPSQNLILSKIEWSWVLNFKVLRFQEIRWVQRRGFEALKRKGNESSQRVKDDRRCQNCLCQNGTCSLYPAPLFKPQAMLNICFMKIKGLVLYLGLISTQKFPISSLRLTDVHPNM